MAIMDHSNNIFIDRTRVYTPFWDRPPCDFLAHLNEASLEQLLSQSVTVHMSQGQSIFLAGTKSDDVYILKSGRVKIYELSATGKEVILWFCMPGELFGLAKYSQISTQKSSHQVSANAYASSEILVIKRDIFNNFIINHPETSLILLDLISSRMRMLSSLILAMATENVSTRLCKLLCSLLDRHGQWCTLHPKCDHGYIDLTVTHQEIADMIGTTRQSVSTLISNLKQQGVLFIYDRKIYIQDISKLDKMAGQTLPVPWRLDKENQLDNIIGI